MRAVGSKYASWRAELNGKVSGQLGEVKVFQVCGIKLIYNNLESIKYKM